MGATSAITDESVAAYILHAREINAVARETLRIDTHDATFIARKISIGLSLQGIELAGKAILRALGQTAAQIRKQHKRHDVLALLNDAESQVGNSSEPALQPFHGFMSWHVKINDRTFSATAESYLAEHFSRGASARPRNYFYPDEPTFTAPKPVQTVLVIADYLINIADGVASAVGSA